MAAPCAEEDVSRHGMLELDQEMRVTSFLEKPAPAETRSRTQSPCCYLLSPGAVRWRRQHRRHVYHMMTLAGEYPHIWRPTPASGTRWAPTSRAWSGARSRCTLSAWRGGSTSATFSPVSRPTSTTSHLSTTNTMASTTNTRVSAGTVNTRTTLDSG